MPKVETMTLDEKLVISNKACLLLRARNREGYNRLMRSVPIPPFLAVVTHG